MALAGVAVVAAIAAHASPSCAARGAAAALHSTRTQAFVGPDGRPVILNGVNVIAVWGPGAGRTWDRADYRSIARHGFNSVRFVVYWDELEPQRGAFDRARLATLDRAVAAARAARLRVILDMVHLWGADGMRSVPGWARAGDSVATVQASAIPYVRMLAARYADDPTVAAYDPVNEPYRWPIDQDAVLRMYDRLIRAIREVAPRKIVLVEPTYGDSSLSGGCADMAKLAFRRDVVVSIHDYFAGGDGDGFGAGCGQTGRHSFDGATGYEPRAPDELRAHLDAYLRVLARAGLPLEVGEFGMGVHAHGQRRWVRDTVRLFDQLGLSRAWWEYRTESNGGSLSAIDARGRWRPFTRLLTAAPAGPRAVPEAKGVPTCA
jgi:Cellulase (glycosyl hydrolase family 5)